MYHKRSQFRLNKEDGESTKMSYESAGAAK